MKVPALFLVASLLTGSVAACSDESDAAGANVDCKSFCARSVGCENDPAKDCVSSCQMSGQLCPEETTAVHSCAGPRPNSDFHCDPDVGVTTLNDGVCSTEGDALIDCVFAAAF